MAKTGTGKTTPALGAASAANAAAVPRETVLAKAVKAAAVSVPPEQAPDKPAIIPAAKKDAAKKSDGKADKKSGKQAVKQAAKQAAETEAEARPRKTKLVRDSFTMPEDEYAVLGELKKACLKAGIEVKKSELLRAGVALLKRLDAAAIGEVLGGLPSLKAGRPKKSK